jgi:hypothetical protein
VQAMQAPSASRVMEECPTLAVHLLQACAMFIFVFGLLSAASPSYVVRAAHCPC